MKTSRRSKHVNVTGATGRRGFLTMDAIVAVMLIMGVSLIFYAGLQAYSRAREDSFLRQRIMAAAESELQRIAAGLAEAPADGGQMERDASGMHLRILAADGDGDWRGLRLVTVQCEAAGSRGGVIHGELLQYMASNSADAGGAP